MSLSNRTLSRLALVAITVLISTVLVVPAQPAAASTSDLPFVMRFPQETDVTVMHDDFGAARSGGRRHTGNDLMAPKMTQVYAAGPEAIRRRMALQQQLVDAVATILGVTPADASGRFACEVLVAAIGSMVIEPLVSHDPSTLRDLHGPLMTLVRRALADG